MIIIQDTREKFPWNFEFYGLTQVRKKLDTGDYAIEGDNHFLFERKRNCGEIALNLGKKWKQFENEMQRMKDYVCPFIICEFPMSDIDTFPANSGIPKSQWQYLRMSPAFIKKRLFESCEYYGIQLLFFENSKDAEREVFNIINEKFKIKR